MFLNIWATWCRTLCEREMPSIAKLARDPRLQSKNVEFVCVSTDDSAETVRRFLTGKDWTMTILRARQDTRGFLLPRASPPRFLIGPDGRIAAKKVGGWPTGTGRASWRFSKKLASSPAAVR